MATSSSPNPVPASTSTSTFASTSTSTSTSTSSQPASQSFQLPKEKVCIIGSGNWASAISIMIGNNCQKLPFCQSAVNMYVYEELITLPEPTQTSTNEPQKLSDIINTKHENVKYLPNIPLPPNVIAVPNVLDAIRGATLLIFCLPHQFLTPILHTIRENYQLLHPNCRGVSLIKGMDYDPISKSPILISKSIQDILNKNNNHRFSCGVLMGANVANGVAREEICESTLATNFDSKNVLQNNDAQPLNKRTTQIFHTDTFRIQHTKDIYGAEACGALKNIIALGCGFIDSMYDINAVHNGGAGSNTKAALIRVGLLEMKRFCQLFLEGVEDDTFTQSCGIADLITTCYSGRNYKCAREFGYRRQRHGQQMQQQQKQENMEKQWEWDAKKCKHEWSEIEKSLLNGQKLQGTLTCEEVYTILSSRDLLRYFPLINIIYEIAFQGKRVDHIVDGILVVDHNADGDGNGAIHLRSKL